MMSQTPVTGIDLVEISRIANSMKNTRFLERVFSSAELELLRERSGGRCMEELHRSISAVNTAAANFCAKEAFSKALGTGIRGFALSEVSILRDELGRPYFLLSGRAQRIVEERRLILSVSLSHAKEYACAVVVGVTSE